MADEAFALSPISARATQPREEDYDAISEAFMETARGRWFLGEYAKRNRNADTRMVLDAIARIEHSIAAQRQPAAEPDNRLAEALDAIRRAVDQGRTAAFTAIDDLALDDKLAPVRKGARVIKEIAWRWREIGADGRICDLLDSQVVAIESACGQIATADPIAALGAAFDLIEGQIAQAGHTDAAGATTQAAVAPATATAPSDRSHAAAMQTAAAKDSENAIRSSSMLAEAALAAAEAVDVMEAADAMAEADDAIVVVAEVTLGITAAPPDAVEPYDDTLLDMVAAEMAAPDAFDDYPVSDTEADEIHAGAAAPLPAAIQPSPQPAAAELALEAPPEPARSLGESLIASGILQRPRPSQSDPLAPIRRMSQAEKIALFS